MALHGNRGTSIVVHGLLSLFLAVLAAPTLASGLASGQTPLPLIPMPAKVDIASGQHRLSADTPLRYRDAAATATTQRFSELLERTTGLRLTPSPMADADDGEHPPTGLEFALDPAAGIPAEG